MTIVFLHTNTTMETTSPTLSGLHFLPQKNTFRKKPTQRHKNQYLKMFGTYREGLNINTGNKNPIVVDENSLFSQHSMSSPSAFDSVKNCFRRLNDSNSLGNIDYDDHNNTNIENSINHVYIFMGIQELNTLHHICELERTQLLTIIAISTQNPQLAGFLLKGKRSNFLYLEGSTAWL